MTNERIEHACRKAYLGDGLFVQFEHSTEMLILTTEDGTEVTNMIFLEPEVLRELDAYVRELRLAGLL